jgi:hypothetical protein
MRAAVAFRPTLCRFWLSSDLVNGKYPQDTFTWLIGYYCQPRNLSNRQSKV